MFCRFNPLLRKLLSDRKNSINLLKSNHCSTDTMLFKAVISKLEQLAPPSLAESWDNVGLLVEPSDSRTRQVDAILVTNDLTELVVEEAVERDADLIISYHPPIFSAIKKLSGDRWKDRCILKCIENKIGIYSPHTCYDAVQGGVNDWLAQAFQGSVTVIDQSMEKSSKQTHQVKLVVTDQQANSDYIQTIKSGIEAALGEGSCRTWLIDADLISSKGYQSASVFCNQNNVLKIITHLQAYGNKVSSHIIKLDSKPIPNCGMGRICHLSKEMSLQDVIKRIKEYLGLAAVQVAVAHDKTLESGVNTVAMCAGSGSSVLRGVRSDVYWTGEMSHHDILDAVSRGSSVVLCCHSNTERGYLNNQLVSVLNQTFEGKVKILISEKDKDPLQFI